ncbi:hypothetical protein GCN74_26765 [Janthinobacterium sp. FT14W]|uniref:hypothetical protein n=1 Tax=Janthinobacterium sp. FT14W TaxID=2654253 RepID=UPI001265A62F|nr:hypothetical protein [Janthinobacterium sp. FT14W]KAB8050751.1 hypothetical protein GCN74_26765 [Janthinobacterium sp. FT14W]
MGQAKTKRNEGFSPQLIDEWEADDCVNFAVALTRTTGWLLHVDWWSTSSPGAEISVDQLKPLRVYVADNRDGIFDVRGVRTIDEFNQRTIIKIANKIGVGMGGVLTRYYDETRLPSLPLRCQPNETKVAEAMEAIKVNPAYLATIPKRPTRCIPAYDAARYTFGRCSAFAEAMYELTGLQPVALLATKFSPQFAATRRAKNGYFHSLVMHPDGMAEDAWGKASIEEIAGRFGAIEFRTSSDAHRQVIENMRRSSAEIYNEEYKKALEIIREYRTEQRAV